MRQNLGTYIPATAELAIVSTVIAVIVGVVFGVVAAVRRNRSTDHVLRVVSLAGISMPTFWIALVALYVFFFRLGWFPAATGSTRASSRRRTRPASTPSTPPSPASGARPGTRSTTSILPALVLAAFNVGLLRATRGRPSSR